MCSKGVTVNCTVVVEMARDSEKIAWDDIEISNSTDSNSTNITKIPSGIFDGSYCPGESYLSWCPGGYYCPNPEEMYLCPEGYFCPPKSMKFEFKCSDSKCGPGATFNQPQVLVQIITASTVLLLTLLVGIIMIINDRLQKQYEASVFAQRRGESRLERSELPNAKRIANCFGKRRASSLPLATRFARHRLPPLAA